MMPIAPRTVGSRFATPAEVTTRGGIGAEIREQGSDNGRNGAHTLPNNDIRRPQEDEPCHL
ncbi:hypothetical protein [Mycobacterium persicum]|uniref:hypothetical protein n=1 Tax=Mycobacterium persicum TaxID=1487726 RepID=UPI001ABFF10D|nr:hypothetical protein [Mycobacterium persicum]